MNERADVVTKACTEGELVRLAQQKRPVDAYALAYLYRMAIDEGVALGDNLLSALATQSDDALLTVVATAHAEIENVATPYRWVQQLAENMIDARLHARRAERGGVNDKAPIAIPHPLVDVRNEAVYAPSYEVDVDALETVLPALSEDEQRKLLRIEPERIEPAYVVPERVVPRRVLAGNTTSIKALGKKYAGSDVGRVIDAALTREFRGFKTAIRIKPATTPQQGLKQ